MRLRSWSWVGAEGHDWRQQRTAGKHDRQGRQNPHASTNHLCGYTSCPSHHTIFVSKSCHEGMMSSQMGSTSKGSWSWARTKGSVMFRPEKKRSSAHRHRNESKALKISAPTRSNYLQTSIWNQSKILRFFAPKRRNHLYTSNRNQSKSVRYFARKRSNHLCTLNKSEGQQPESTIIFDVTLPNLESSNKIWISSNSSHTRPWKELMIYVNRKKRSKMRKRSIRPVVGRGAEKDWVAISRMLFGDSQTVFPLGIFSAQSIAADDTPAPKQHK